MPSYFDFDSLIASLSRLFLPLPVLHFSPFKTAFASIKKYVT